MTSTRSAPAARPSPTAPASPRTRAEAEDLYVAARDRWVAAMRAAASGRPSDLAALALAQDEYEAAAAEREAWEAGRRTAISVEPKSSQRDLGAIVEHELAWRSVREPGEKRLGVLGRIRRRLRG